MTRGRFRLCLALVATLAVAAYLFAWWPTIGAWSFPDPDDQMRLQEVRDFLAGQAWRDVSQHRMNAPWGAAMHWSRLIDLPLAAVMLASRPFLGPHGAEVAAVIAVPALTLVTTMALVALLTRRLIDPVSGLVAAALLPLTTGAMLQMRPLRIDHHGWQVALALGLTLALIDREAARGGRIAGALAAVWLTISLEGLPFCAAAGALAALRWTIDPVRDGGRFAGFAGVLAAGLAVLFALLRPAAAWGAIACDAVSPVHLVVLGVAALGALAATRAARTLPMRGIALLVVGAACAACYAAIAPVCTRGAFAELDPLTYRYWYLNVTEGLPVWRLSPGAGLSAIGFPLVALIGTGFALRTARDRPAWIDHALLLIAATVVAACVQRAGAVANALALPGGIALMRLALARIERWRNGPARVLASAATLTLLLPPAPALLGAAWASARAPATPQPAAQGRTCGSSADYATAGALPPSNLMTNIDIGPGILFTTRHRVVASSHHRNRAGIHDALATFIGSPDLAHAILDRRGIDYLVVCASMSEMAVYARANPAGFWAQLNAGRRFAWAEPVRIPGSPLSIWRIRR